MRNKTLFFLIIIVDIIASCCRIYSEYDRLSVLPVLVLMFCIFKSTPIQNIYILAGTCALANVFQVGSIGVYGILMFFSAIRYAQHINSKAVVAILLIVPLLVLHDYSYTSYGMILTYSCAISSLFVLLSCGLIYDYDHNISTILFVISLLICNTGSYLMTGNFADLIDTGNDLVRLGQDIDDEYSSYIFGGAMGFPVNSVLAISFLVTYLISNRLTTFQRYITYLLLALIFVVTFFTISKVYLLGLFVIVVCVILSINRISNFKKVCIIFLAVIGVEALIYSGYSELLLNRFLFRVSAEDGLTTGRERIIVDSIQYLSNNIDALLFGKGLFGYRAIGESMNMAFQMSAHNIILDCVLAFGLLGLSIIAKYLIDFFNEHKFGRVTVIAFMPFLCWFVMCLTNSPFLLMKNYIILPFLILHAVCCDQIMNPKDLE